MEYDSILIEPVLTEKSNVGPGSGALRFQASTRGPISDR